MAERCTGKMSAGVGLTSVFALCVFPALAWGSLRVGNAEMQVAVSMQHTFQYDDGEYGLDWVQFRNELAVKFTYEKLVENDLLFEQLRVPHIQRADFFLAYRGRFDPVYLLRQRYHRLFDNETVHNFIFPENEVREIFLDVDFGPVGPGSFSLRVGRQQIVWGEADLFRSLDVINPLKFDQNGLVGERFEDYRNSLYAIKFLYSMGTLGPLSEVGIEPFYSPNWRPLLNDALIPGASRLYDNDLPRFASTDPLGFPLFKRKANFDKPRQRGNHPWIIARQGPNLEREAPAFLCVTLDRCVGHTVGERIGAYFNFEYDRIAHHVHGIDLINSMGGFRILGKTAFGVDFTLNYLFKRAENTVHVDLEELFDRDASLARGILVPRLDRIYGAGLPGQDLLTGIARCTGSIKPLRGVPGAPAGVFQSATAGKAANQRIGNKGKQESAILIGTDLNGFNANANPADDVGITPGTLAALFGGPVLPFPGTIPLTACGTLRTKYPWTHIMGVTATYNDFDFTGAIFRFEQSFSTKEGRFKYPAVFRRFTNTLSVSRHHLEETFRNNLTTYTPVWRSMIGFDLAQSWSTFPGLRWMKDAPLQIGQSTTFFTGQLLTEYQMDNMSNLFASSAPCTSFSLRDRCNRWTMAATFSIIGQGYAKGQLDPVVAYGHDLNVDSPLLLFRVYWHGLYFKSLDAAVGGVTYMGSKNQGSALLLQQEADKDVVFLRLVYYLL